MTVHKITFLLWVYEPNRVFTRSSKRPALARVFWIHLLEVCWTDAGSCKHPITIRYSVVLLMSVGWLWRTAVVAISPARQSISTRPAQQSAPHHRLLPSGRHQRQLPETTHADERRQRLSDLRAARRPRGPRGTLPGQQLYLHTSFRRHFGPHEPLTGFQWLTGISSGRRLSCHVIAIALGRLETKTQDLTRAYGGFAYNSRFLMGLVFLIDNLLTIS